jgi:hypothetical protein
MCGPRVCTCIMLHLFERVGNDMQADTCLKAQHVFHGDVQVLDECKTL